MDPIDLTSVDIAVSKPSHATMNKDHEKETNHDVTESPANAENTAIDKDVPESVDVSIARGVDASEDDRSVDGEMLHETLKEAVASDSDFQSDSQSVSRESNDGNKLSLQNTSESSNVGDSDLSVDDVASELMGGLQQQKDDVETQNPVKEEASSQADNSSSSLVTDAPQSSQQSSEQLSQEEDTTTSDAISKNGTTNTTSSNAVAKYDTTNPTDGANETDISNNTQSPPSNNTTKDDDDDDEEPTQQILVDYASKVSGGQILEKSPSLKGTSNLLTADMDRYAIAPCQDKKYVVIGLSEDILVKIVKLANYERYSSHVKEFQVLSSQEYPVPSDQWTDLGTYTALSKSGEQTFELKDAAWARYLKFKFLSHYGVEHYCTVSQIKVHGSTMLQGFHEQWIESEKMEKGEDVGDGEAWSEDEEERIDQDEEVDAAAEGANWTQEGVEAESNAGPVVDRESIEESSDTAESHVSVEETNNTDQEKVSSGQIEECVKEGAADTKDKDENLEDGCNINIESGLAADADSHKTDSVIQHSSISQLPSEAATDLNGDTKQQVASGSASSSSQLVDDSNIVDDSKGAVSPADDSSNVSSPYEETSANNEKNSSIYAVADAVKAASDAIKSVKEAVQSADAVTEIKKMIRTTIAVIDEDHKTGLGLLEIANDTVDGSVIPPNVTETVDDQVSDLNVKEPDRMASGDNGSLTASNDKPSSEAALKDVRMNDAENTTTVLKYNHISGKENATKTDTRAASSNGAADDKSKSQSNTSTLKVEPSATHPRQRNNINAAAIDNISKLMSKYPSASCIKSLDFQTFKSKSLVTNVVPGSAVGGAKMEPIFQKITSEIKSVQTTQHQYEQFINAIKTCYEHVLADMATDVDTMQSKFNARLTVLEMMLLERSDVRPNRPSTFFGFPVPATFPISTISAFLPFPMIFDSSEGMFMCLAIVLFFIMMWRSKRKRNVADISAHDSDFDRLLSSSRTTTDTVTQVKIPTRKKCHFEDDISPLPIHEIKNGFDSSNLRNDISHDISCGESDCSTPSISLSEPIGTTAGFDGPPSLATKKGNHRNRFRIRRRTKSDGTRTP
ncbi:hypothetical protein HJC23_010832 [Cyclotella cryptica]|uniref:SUN domain-containing protein n=1 Tax=Cyclotella cryptica TaxID=29204 RepID=A0ABD3QSS9_9STRA